MKGKITISFQSRVIVTKKTSIPGKGYDIANDESVWEIMYQSVIEPKGLTSGPKITHIHLKVWGVIAQVTFHIRVPVQELCPDCIGILSCTLSGLRKNSDSVAWDASPFFIAFNVRLQEEADSLILNDIDCTGTGCIS